VSDSLLDLASLLPSWKRALRAERKSPATVKSYAEGVLAFLRWCEQTGTAPVLSKAAAQDFVIAILDNGGAAKTAGARLLGLRRFSAWLADPDGGDELDIDPLIGMKQPKVDKKVIEALTDDELKALFAACHGRGFTDRRDEAIVRLMAETGMRAGEVIALTVDDVDVERGIVTVQRGKGGKGRISPFGPQTATAIDRYLRVRRSHKLAATPTLWVGADNWRTFSYFALRRSLVARAESAGIKDFHPHKLRHTFATRWLRGNGSEGGLMAMAGWSTRDMIDRYTGASASERAAAEARTLGLGEL
jgi:integrase